MYMAGGAPGFVAHERVVVAARTGDHSPSCATRGAAQCRAAARGPVGDGALERARGVRRRARRRGPRRPRAACRRPRPRRGAWATTLRVRNATASAHAIGTGPIHGTARTVSTAHVTQLSATAPCRGRSRTRRAADHPRGRSRSTRTGAEPARTSSSPPRSARSAARDGHARSNRSMPYPAAARLLEPRDGAAQARAAGVARGSGRSPRVSSTRERHDAVPHARRERGVAPVDHQGLFRGVVRAREVRRRRAARSPGRRARARDRHVHVREAAPAPREEQRAPRRRGRAGRASGPTRPPPPRSRAPSASGRARRSAGRRRGRSPRAHRAAARERDEV